MLSEWLSACAGMGHIGTPMYYRKLRKQYAEVCRHYHDFSHIAACLKALKRFFPKDRDVADVKMALFFHDAVYNPYLGDNEERSAAQWVDYATSRNVHPSNIRAVERMILDSKTHTIHGYLSTRNEKVFLDLDMAIFIAEPKAYMNYAQNVWREYREYGKEAYIKGRLDFLQKLEPARLFYTPELRAHSRQAELNIAHEIATLQNGADQFLV